MSLKLLKLLMFASKQLVYVFVCQLVALQFLFADVNSQSIEHVYVSINLKNVPLTKVISEIEQQTDFVFVYDKRVTESKEPFTLKLKSVSVADVLRKIMQSSSFRFKQINNNITILKEEDAQASLSVPEEQHAEITISGTVTEIETKEPMPGVNVAIKGTTFGTVTDNAGRFTLNVPNESAVLVFTFIGYTPVEEVIGSRSVIDVSLSADVMSLDEVVVIGYGAQDKRDVTTSVASIKAKDFVNQPVVGFDQALAGKLAGVQVSEPSGAPGAAMKVRIRGTSSISAGNDPLYVVDGVPISTSIKFGPGEIGAYPDQPYNPLSSINMNDIESIEVLKDASAAAIYGSRGSNGVVIITTKKGASGKPTVSYNSYVGIQSVSRKIDMLDAYEYAAFKRDAQNNAYLDAVSTGSAGDDNATRAAKAAVLGLSLNQGWLVPPELTPYLNGEQGLTNTDWQDAIFRDAVIHNHTVSVSGGRNDLKYFISGSYLDQDGIVLNSGYKLYSTRINISSGVSDKIRVGVNISPSFEVHRRVNSEGHQGDDGVISTALITPPIWPVYNPDGNYNWSNNLWGYRHSDALNPVALANEIQDRINHARFLGNAYAEFDLFKDFTYRLSAGVDYNTFRRDYFMPSTVETRGRKGPSQQIGFSKSSQFMNWLLEHTLTYKRSFGNHNVVALAGFTAQKERADNTQLQASQYPNDLVPTLNAGQISAGGTTLEEWSLLSYLGRVQYDFKGKYLMSATIRSDGSSRFGKSNKWGLFPSASIGWRISDEAFMSGVKAVSDLKLRGSYGQTGNFQIPNYGSVALIGEADYALGAGDGVIANGLTPITAANPGLRWEKTRTIDVGVDIGLFENKLFIEFDHYNSKTSDLLLFVPVPESSGFSTSLQNIGEVSNKGYEVTLTSKHQLGQFKLETKVNVSTNKNEVLSLGGNDDPIIAIGGATAARFITKVGEPIGSYLTLVHEGVLMSQEEVNTVPIYANSRPGDFKFRDVNNDGKITVDGDAIITGSYFPDYTFGLTQNVNYKSIDFSFSLQGVQGNEVFSLFKRYFDNMEGNMNNVDEAKNRWISPTEPGDGQTNRANRFQTGGNAQMSTWHIEDGSYVRIRNITLGYTLPVNFTQKAFISRARIYAAAQNPFTFTNYLGYNPEVNSRPDNALSGGEDYGSYPLARTFSVGLNVTFK